MTPDVECTYPAGSFGELDGNVTGLLAEEEHNTTPFGLEADTAPEFYLNGKPGPDTSTARNFERAVGGLTADDPYTGNPKQKLALDLADPTEEAILHMVDADPARTPTLAMFANPDYYRPASDRRRAPGIHGARLAGRPCAPGPSLGDWLELRTPLWGRRHRRDACDGRSA